MLTTGRTAALILMLAFVVLLIAPAQPARAHVRAPEAATGTTPSVERPITAIPVAPPALPARGLPTPAPLWPVAALAAAVLLVAVTPRPTLALALVFVLTIFATETAVHSVHHLSDQQASGCVAASASAHVHGAALDPPAELLCLAARPEAVVAIESSFPGSRSLRPDEGRAPPA